MASNHPDYGNRTRIAALYDPFIESLLAELPDGLDPLECASRLRGPLERAQAAAAAELYALRRRARGKLLDPERLLLTRKGLEQATHWRVADLRARRIAPWMREHGGGGALLDATAGIGGEGMALVRAGVEGLVAAEADPDLARFLRRNLAGSVTKAASPPAVVCARFEDDVVRHAALLLDPDRRAGASTADSLRSRAGHPEAWSPSWSVILGRLQSVRAACVKLPPGQDVRRLIGSTERPHRWQWNSLGGELKELVLWWGAWAEGTPAEEREVNAIRNDGAVSSWCAVPRDVAALDHDAAQGVGWICEPDPALIRAELVGALAAEEGLAPLAPGLAYLGGEHAARSPLLTSFEVLGSVPLDRKRVRRLLAQHDVGPLTVKKRGHPEGAQVLEKRFAGSGSRRGLLIVARLEASHRAYLVRPLQG